jgi:NAD(P)-dependent dehydrogenase (short-subunit alcohol dehydrogenase family)
VELANRVAVVTGGASGIGRGMALRFAQEDVRGIAVADLDEDGVQAVARQIGDKAIAIGCDVSDEGQVRALLDTVNEQWGQIDLFCANAGIGTGTGLDTPDSVWDQAFNVNIRAHVLAARHVVPEWLERGEGYFLSTASAAGLLTQIGDAPYSVTKHAAVAFAEWLSITYGHMGLRVSCLCPMGVNTTMLQTGLELVGEEGVGARVVAAAGRVLEPEEVAEEVVEAIRDERFLILPHAEVAEFFRRRGDDHERWLAGMRRLQAQIVGAS